MNRTLILIKPDAFDRNIEKILIKRIFDLYPLVHIKDVVITEELCDQHYEEHVNKPFYPGLKEAMVGKKVIALEVLSSFVALGSIDSGKLAARLECENIRKEYVDSQYVGPRNIIHCSDSIEAGIIECDLWFGKTVESLPANLPKKKSNCRLASKIIDTQAFLDRLDDELMECDTKLSKDLEKVQFDFENCSWQKGEYDMYGDLLGYNKIGDFQFCGVAAGGDWQYPVFFLVYLDKDGKTLRGFIPKEGNAWNYDTNQALGNAEEDEDIKFLTKALKINGDITDLDDDPSSYGEELINIDLLKETIASRFEVV
jgi:nucleoside-diphosphate kinase